MGRAGAGRGCGLDVVLGWSDDDHRRPPPEATIWALGDTRPVCPLAGQEEATGSPSPPRPPEPPAPPSARSWTAIPGVGGCGKAAPAALRYRHRGKKRRARQLSARGAGGGRPAVYEVPRIKSAPGRAGDVVRKRKERRRSRLSFVVFTRPGSRSAQPAHPQLPSHRCRPRQCHCGVLHNAQAQHAQQAFRVDAAFFFSTQMPLFELVGFLNGNRSRVWRADRPHFSP